MSTIEGDPEKAGDLEEANEELDLARPAAEEDKEEDAQNDEENDENEKDDDEKEDYDDDEGEEEEELVMAEDDFRCFSQNNEYKRRNSVCQRWKI